MKYLKAFENSNSDTHWTEEDIRFMKRNYRDIGVTKCAIHLSKDLEECRSKAKELGINTEKDNIIEKLSKILNHANDNSLLDNLNKRLEGKKIPDTIWTFNYFYFFEGIVGDHWGISLTSHDFYDQGKSKEGGGHFDNIDVEFLKVIYNFVENSFVNIGKVMKKINESSSLDWTEEEIEFLKNNYYKLGAKACSKQLPNRTKKACFLKAKKLGLSYDRSHRWGEDNLKDIVSNNTTKSGVLRDLGLSIRPGNYGTLDKYLRKYNIDTSHFSLEDNKQKLGNYRKKYKTPLEEILVKDSTYTNRTKLKNKLYKEGLKERKCEDCGQDENWRGKYMSLILDHINGVNNDNRIENLRILCPNCNATLKTHGGRNRKKNK